MNSCNISTCTPNQESNQANSTGVQCPKSHKNSWDDSETSDESVCDLNNLIPHDNNSNSWDSSSSGVEVCFDKKNSLKTPSEALRDCDNSRHCCNDRVENTESSSTAPKEPFNYTNKFVYIGQDWPHYKIDNKNSNKTLVCSHMDVSSKNTVISESEDKQVNKQIDTLETKTEYNYEKSLETSSENDTDSASQASAIEKHIFLQTKHVTPRFLWSCSDTISANITRDLNNLKPVTVTNVSENVPAHIEGLKPVESKNITNQADYCDNSNVTSVPNKGDLSLLKPLLSPVDHSLFGQDRANNLLCYISSVKPPVNEYDDDDDDDEVSPIRVTDESSRHEIPLVSNQLGHSHASVRPSQRLNENAEAWVLLETNGKTQQVTSRDVNILLGGRSVASVVAESKPHQLRNNRNPRNETGSYSLTCVPELMIQESLQLLSQHDEIGGDRTYHRHVNLERKEGTMLMFITDHDSELSVPSVRFINIDSEMVHIWKRSNEFNSPSTSVNSNWNAGRGRIIEEPVSTVPVRETCSSSFDKSNFQNDWPSVPGTSTESSRANNLTDNFQENPREIVARYRDLALEIDKKYKEEKLKCAKLESELMKLRDHTRVIEHDEKFISEYHFHKSACEKLNLQVSTNSKCSHDHAVHLNDLKRDIKEIKEQINHSESNVKDMISKYIKDRAFEKHLKDAVSNYSQVLVHSDNRTNFILENLVEEEITILRSQNKASENLMENLKKRNCKIEEENVRLNEKAQQLQSQLKEFDLHFNQPQRDTNLDTIENLKSKLVFTQERMVSAEGRVEELQQEVEDLKVRVQMLKQDLENLKMMKSQSDDAHHTEKEILNKELKQKNHILKESLEVATQVVNDIQAFKRRLRGSCNKLHINWKHFKTQGSNSFADFLIIFRACVNEMGREILQTHNQLKLSEENEKRLKEENHLCHEFLNLLRNQYDCLKMELDQANKEKFLNSDQLRSAKETLEVIEEKLMQLEKNQLGLKYQHDLLDKQIVILRVKEDIGAKISIAFEDIINNKQSAKLTKKLEVLTSEKIHLLERVKDIELKSGHLEMLLDDKSKNFEEVVRIYEKKLSELERINVKLVSDAKSFNEVILQTSSQCPEMKGDSSHNEIEVTCCGRQTSLQTSENVKDIRKKHSVDIMKLEGKLDTLLEENKQIKGDLEESQHLIHCLECDNYALMANLGKVQENQTFQVNYMPAIEGKQWDIKQLGWKSKGSEMLQKMCEEKDIVISALQAQYNEIYQQFEDYKKELSNSHKTIEELKNALTLTTSNKNSQIVNATKENTALQSLQLNTNENAIMTVTNHLDPFIDVGDETSEINYDLQCILKDHENIVKQHIKLIENLRNYTEKVEEQHKNLKDCQDKCILLSKQNTELASYANLLEKKLQSSNGNLLHYCSKVKNLKSLKSNLKDAERKISEYENQLILLDREANNYAEKIERVIGRQQTENIEIQRALGDLQRLYQQHKFYLRKALSCVKITSQRAESAYEENVLPERRDNEIILKQYEDTKKMYERLRHQLDEANNACSVIYSEYLSYQKKLMKKEGILLQKQYELERCHTEIKHLLNEKQHMKKTMEIMQKVAIASQESYSQMEDDLNKQIDDAKERDVEKFA